MAKKHPAKERRQHDRGGTSVCAWLTFQNDKRVYSSIPVDLSEHGAQFSTEKGVGEGETVQVNMQLDSTMVECVGNVMWALSPSEGFHKFEVSFVNLPPEQRDNIKNFVARQGKGETVREAI